MGNLMEFLARVGQDAALRYGPPADREALLSTLDIHDEATRHALVAGGADELRALLGGVQFIASQMPGPDEEKAPPADDDDDTDEDGNPPMKKKAPGGVPTTPQKVH